MPKWIHDRADHLQERNPEMPKSQAFAIATQQAHKIGKTPKGYGTAEGKKKAKMKYVLPKKEYRKTAGFTPFKPPKFGPANLKASNPAAKLQKSQQVGAVQAFDQKKDGIQFKPPSMPKVAFQTSQYSGPLTLGRFKSRSRSGMPYNPGGIKVGGPPSELGDKESPDTEPHEAKREDDKVASLAGAAVFAIDAVSHWEAKEATISSPASQLNSSQTSKAGPKLTAPAGPSIAQVAKPIGFGRPLPGATKTATMKEAALKELVRLGLKDIPNTPRLLMKKRSPAARASLGLKAEKAYDAKVTDPLKGLADRALLSRMPEGKGKALATKVTNAVASDPVGMTASNLVPFPGAVAAYVGAKKGLAKVVDKIDPVQAAKATA